MKIYKKKSIRKGQNSVKCYQILGKTVLRKEKNDAIKKYAFFGEKWGIFKQKKSELIEGKSVKQAAEPVPQAVKPIPEDPYKKWVRRLDTICDQDVVMMKEAISEFKLLPKFSVVMPVYNTDIGYLEKAIHSVLDQTYPYWELCIADDASPDQTVRDCIASYAAIDNRIRYVFRKENGNISVSSNDAINLATGEFIVLFDHDDILDISALFCLAEKINALDGKVDLLYTDEDKIDEDGNRFNPYFKPDWNRALFLQQNFIAHLGCYRTAIAKEIGGFRAGFEGSQDYDFALRFIARISESRISHIDRILYHWRKVPEHHSFSTDFQDKSDAAAKRSLEELFAPRGWKIEPSKTMVGCWHWVLPKPADEPLISIIIPTKNHAELIKRCVDSILSKTTYKNYEILIVDNKSEEEAALAYYEELSGKEKIRLLHFDEPFNYSKINNFAARAARGDYLLLLNNDTEVITGDWLDSFIKRFAADPTVGVIGAKLLYPDGSIQHAGVVTGIYKVASHPFRFQKNDPYFGYCSLDRYVSAVTGACLIIRKSLFDQVGGLDEEKLRISFNDVDLCLKVKQRGYHILWTPDVILNHYESQTRGKDETPKKKLVNFNERKAMLERYGDSLFFDEFYNSNLSLDSEGYEFTQFPRKQKPWKKDSIDFLCPFHRGDVIVGLAVAVTYSTLSDKKLSFHISRDLYDWIAPFLYSDRFRIIRNETRLPAAAETFGKFIEAMDRVVARPDFSGKLATSHNVLSFEQIGTDIVTSMLLGLGLPADTRLKRLADFRVPRKREHKKRILIHPYGSWKLKTLPLETIEKIIGIAHQHGYSVTQVGGASDKKIAGFDDYCLRNEDVVYWFSLLKNSACIVCCDSWFSHFAAFIDFPSITFYGSTSARHCSSREHFEEGWSRYLVIDSGCELAPCDSLTCKLDNGSVCKGFRWDNRVAGFIAGLSEAEKDIGE